MLLFCSSRHGFIIAVLDIVEVGAAKIMPSRGHVLIPVKYKAIVFRPFKSEVLDAVVTTVTKVETRRKREKRRRKAKTSKR